MKNKILLFVLTVAIYSCGKKSNSDKFIGFWKNTKMDSDVQGPNLDDLWVIGKKNNFEYVLLLNRKKHLLQYDKENDNLVFNDGGNSIKIFYDKKSKRLTTELGEFEKTTRYRYESGGGQGSRGGMDKDDQSFFVDQVLKEY